MEKVFVVGPFNGFMRSALEHALPADAYKLEYLEDTCEYGQLKDADYVILRTLPIDAEQMANLKKARLIQRWGAGFDTVAIQEAGRRGIQVAVTSGMNATPVAEMVLALNLAIYRNLVPLTNGIIAGKWEREEYSKRSYTIWGKTVGIYGCGSIGKKVAHLYRAFGAEVIYYDPFRLTAQQEQSLEINYVQPEDLWKMSDIITLHAPLTQQTRQVISRDTLYKMKRNALLINTAREEMIDYSAVAEALRTGGLLGAGFDAIEEGFVQSNPFAGMSNVVLSAHLGGNTVDNAVHMAARCAEQILAVSNGQRLAAPHLVNGQYLI